MSTYQKIIDRIDLLSKEQLHIYSDAAHGGLSDKQRNRLAEVKTELQDLWYQRKQGRTNRSDPLDQIGREPPRWP